MIKTSTAHADHVYSEWLQILNIFRQELELIGKHLAGLESKAIIPDAANRITLLKARLAAEQKNIDDLDQHINEGLDSIGEHSEMNGSWYLENRSGAQYHSLSEEFAAASRTVDHLKRDFNELNLTFR